MREPIVAPPAARLPAQSFEFAGGYVDVFPRAAEIDRELWETAFAGQPKDFEYYRLIEETLGEHFSYAYLLIRNAARQPIAIQPLIFATQDLLTSASATVTSVIEKLRQKWPGLLRNRMLMAGCLVGEGHLGVIPPHEPAAVASFLAEGLERVADSEGISLVVLKDFPATDRQPLASLVRSGYTRLEGFPPLELELSFNSFDEYLRTRLSKVTRKSVRRKLRSGAAAIPPITCEVLMRADEIIDEVYPLYLNVAHRSEISFEVFTRDYFLEAARRMPGRFLYFVWRQAGRAVAFSFCTVWNGTIFDNDIGLDYSVAHQLHLYDITFRDIINWALANGLTRYCSAPFNYETKFHLRLDPIPVDIYVRHRSPVWNAMLRRIAPIFAPARSDAALRRHAAAHGRR